VIAPSLYRVVLGLLCALSIGCQPPRQNIEPAIEFTTLPKADEGGTDNLAIIEGRVTGALPGQRIVLLARSGVGVWWVQPFADQPFTTIQPDLTWNSSTHLGTEYAALLVDAGYQPQATSKVLPEKGGPVAAVATAEGERSARRVSRTLHFSGYEWEIRNVPSDRGGKLNSYDPANAWTDEQGFLHLRIARDLSGWTCAEVMLTRSLGYGLYRFVVRDSSHLEPAAVLGMFTWDDLGEDQNHREIGIEIGRWGDPDSNNAQYVIQPFYVPANAFRFMTAPGQVTHSLRWQPGRVSFQSIAGAGRQVAQHVFTSGVPLPGGEAVRINLYAFDNNRNPLRNPTEVIVEKFEYLP
jgi:hypothetical protein